MKEKVISWALLFYVSNWDYSEINQRANVLFEDAKTLWKYPKELDLKLEFKNIDKEFYTLDDDIDIAGKKSLYFELFSEKHSTKSWNDLYVNVVKILVDFDWDIAKSLLIDDDFSGKKQRIISSVESDCRKAYEIRDGYFVETNLSANAIMTYVKLICEKFDLSGNSSRKERCYWKSKRQSAQSKRKSSACSRKGN